MATRLFTEAYVRNLSQVFGEPSWLTDFRLDALKKSEELALPTPEKTDIANWDFIGTNQTQITTLETTSLDGLDEDTKAIIGEGNVIVQQPNKKAFVKLSEEAIKQGVIFVDIHTAATEHSELLQKYFMTDGVKVDENKLTALHAAVMTNGVFLYVPKNVVLEEPLQSVFVMDEPVAELYNHVLIVAEDNSAVTYVENYVATEGSAGVASIITEVLVGQNASVSYGAVDTLTEGITSYVNRRGVVGRDGKLRWALGCMNDGDTIHDNFTQLIGDGSFADTKLVTLGRGEQTQNFTTDITHYGKNSEGDILKHGVQKDSASSIFNGIGKIERGAIKTNADQTSRVLMLSEKARGDVNPILLIEENDVLAGHAGSAGRVDEIQLYYFMSRGIPRKEAERLIIHGFLAPVVTELPIKEVKEQLEEVIERKVR